jgi:endoglucanase
VKNSTFRWSRTFATTLLLVGCGTGSGGSGGGETGVSTGSDAGGGGGSDAGSQVVRDAADSPEGSDASRTTPPVDGGTVLDAGSTGDDGGLSVLPPPAAAPPGLSVHGNMIQDPGGATVVLRGVAIPDLGALASSGGGSQGITHRIDEILGAANLAAHVIRFPVYPRSVPNSGSPYYSPMPFPIGPDAPASSGVTVTALSASEYVNTILRPAIDYATSKNLYVIVDYHQIDNTTTGQSGADAVTFWTQMAPIFSNYPNVLYEAFNEPIDNAAPGGWTTAFQTQAQSWINAIRAGAPNNLIIVGSPSWSQYPNGAAQFPLTGGNLVFTAHIYPGNWTPAFQGRVTTAVAAVPVFISEWGYQLVATMSRTDPNANLETTSDAWVNSLETFVDGNGASWTAWVADPAWGPPMFSGDAGGLTDFGTAVQTWLAK